MISNLFINVILEVENNLSESTLTYFTDHLEQEKNMLFFSCGTVIDPPLEGAKAQFFPNVRQVFLLA